MRTESVVVGTEESCFAHTAVQFEAGQEVEVTAQEAGVTVKWVGSRKLTLAENLEWFAPAKHGGEAMVTEPIGAEVFTAYPQASTQAAP
jgi:hypothetical protein